MYNLHTLQLTFVVIVPYIYFIKEILALPKYKRILAADIQHLFYNFKQGLITYRIKIFGILSDFGILKRFKKKRNYSAVKSAIMRSSGSPFHNLISL